MNSTPDPNQSTNPTMDDSRFIETIVGEPRNGKEIERPGLETQSHHQWNHRIGNQSESRRDRPHVT